MFRIISAILIYFLLSVLGALGQQLQVDITGHQELSESDRLIVRGTVSDPNAEVWVVVHPTLVSDFWIQPPIAVEKNGSWEVTVHVGRSGDEDRGKRFEIIAFANPKEELREGRHPQGRWPKSQARSDVFRWTRR